MGTGVNRGLLPTAAALAVTACGGAGSGAAGFIPSPPVSPTPTTPTTPTPTPTPTSATAGALAVPPSGIATTTEFSTTDDAIRIRWNADLKAYEVRVTGFPDGKIVQTVFGAFGAGGDVVTADGAKIFNASARTPYSYSGIIELLNALPSGRRYVAYGTATPDGAVPITGSATYNAELDGHAGGWLLAGTAFLQFDFAAGKLSGYMDPKLNGPMGVPTVPRYTFTETVFSPGNTTFSGKFDISGPTPSLFQGRFTGPNAQELMGTFKAPFLDWDATGNPTVWNAMEGVMIGKRP